MKSILFSSKRNLKPVEELDIRYKDIKIKQYKHANYLGCMLDEWMSGETMSLRVIEVSLSKKSIFRCPPSHTSM